MALFSTVQGPCHDPFFDIVWPLHLPLSQISKWHASAARDGGGVGIGRWYRNMKQHPDYRSTRSHLKIEKDYTEALRTKASPPPSPAQSCVQLAFPNSAPAPPGGGGRRPRKHFFCFVKGEACDRCGSLTLLVGGGVRACPTRELG